MKTLIKDGITVTPWIQEENMASCLNIFFNGKPYMRVYLETVQELKKEGINYSQVAWEIIGRFNETNELKFDLSNIGKQESEIDTIKSVSCYIIQKLSNGEELDEKYQALDFPLIPIYKDMFYFTSESEAISYYDTHNKSIGWPGAIQKFDTLKIRSTTFDEKLNWPKLEFKPENCNHELSYLYGEAICTWCNTPLVIKISTKEV